MTKDVTITIKNIPAKELSLVWQEMIDFGFKNFKEFVEPCDRMDFDFNLMNNEMFNRIVAAAITEHCVSSAKKIAGDA